MQILSAQEALFVACEMERGAIQLYERAICLMEELGRNDEPLYGNLRDMAGDESHHLQQFQELYHGLDAGAERTLLLSAVADGLLMEGGLMGAVRLGLLNSVEDMLRYAEEREAKAVETYHLFAERSRDEQAKKTLVLIAAEEERHLAEIRSKNRGTTD